MLLVFIFYVTDPKGKYLKKFESKIYHRIENFIATYHVW